MKTYSLKPLMFLLVATLSLLTSCQKDDSVTPQEDPTTSGQFFSCTLDGTTYQSNAPFSYGVKGVNEGTVAVYGVQNQPDGTIYIEMPETIGTGTHAFSSDIYAYISIEGKAYSTRFGAPEGTLTITKRTDSHIEGTFNFTAYDSDDFSTTMAVESGKFNVEFRD